jgi:hypothetical protein
VLLCALAASADGTSNEPVVVVGAPVALTSGPVDAWQVGPGVLEPDGTFWALATAPSNDSFVIAARAATGSLMSPVKVSAGPGGAVTDAIAASVGNATVVWESVTNDNGNSGGASVRVRQCRLLGCGAVQTLARWRWTDPGSSPHAPQQEPNPLPAGDLTGAWWALPAVVSVGRRTIVVFGVESPTGPPAVDWAMSDEGRFGPVHQFGASAVPNPVLVPESGGRVLAAWLSWGAPRVDWSIWQPDHGFSGVRSFAAGANAVDLVGAPYEGQAALAWQDSSSGQVKLARQTPSAFTRPTVESTAGGEYEAPSLASGGTVLALAITGDRFDVMTSTAGASFSDLNATGGLYPAMTVNAAGDTLATWQGPGGTGIPTDIELSVAPPGGGFGQPTTVGTGTYDDGPAAYTNGSRSLVLWRDGNGRLVTSQITVPTG